MKLMNIHKYKPEYALKTNRKLKMTLFRIHTMHYFGELTIA